MASDVSRRRAAGLAVAIGVGLALVIGFAWLARPSVVTTSDLRADVAIECMAATGVDVAGCRVWGDTILSADPPSFTFEMDDLSRLEIDRPLAGMGTDCEVRYYLARYADDPVSTDAIACASPASS